MTKDSAAQALRALAMGDKGRSDTARLRDIFQEVEAALAAGVSRFAVVQSINAQGFEMTQKSFESALYRIRKKKSQPGIRAEVGVQQPLVATGVMDEVAQPQLVEGNKARILNPADVRKSRLREINLEDPIYKEKT